MTKQRRAVQKYKNYYVLLLLVILLGLAITAALQFWPHKIDSDENYLYARDVYDKNSKRITRKSTFPPEGDASCLFHTCFDVYNCGYNDETKISVYVYPQESYVDENGVKILPPPSKEFIEVIEAIKNSIYYTPIPDRACMFVPYVDVLNQNVLRLKETGQVLALLSQ